MSPWYCDIAIHYVECTWLAVGMSLLAARKVGPKSEHDIGGGDEKAQ